VTCLLLLPLILSELLANEPGGAVILEWIELAAQQDVNTSAYSLIVNSDSIPLPSLTLDSGSFLVVCRDTLRFEQHYGDSSGIWGDQPFENFPLFEAGFALANVSGAVRLYDTVTADAFTYDTAAPDGTSFERIDDSTWQITDPAVGSTPGTRNFGTPVPFDWALRNADVDPVQPQPGAPVTIRAVLENTGTSSSSTTVHLESNTGTPPQALPLTGAPGAVDTARFALTAQPGLNRFTLHLDLDDRPENNATGVRFLTASRPLIFTEIYAVPAAGEPEWVELKVAADTLITLDSIAFADLRDSTPLDDIYGALAPGAYFVITEDAARFLNHYAGFDGIVLQPPRWPTLNNDGDTLALTRFGIPFERVGYPAFGSKRGVSLERVGDGATWGYSVAPGGTPGADNSIDVPYTDDIRIDVTPNPFAAGDGERAAIRYTVPFNAAGELRLYAGDGRLLRTLLPGSPLVSGEVSWDGRDADGALLPVGIYLLYLKLSAPFERARLATVVIAR